MGKMNVKLLDDAYKNVRMGNHAINCIIEKIQDKQLVQLMKKQNKFYLDATKRLDVLAGKIDYKPKDLDVMLKASSYVGINMKTLFNKDTSHIAEMLIEGTTMGITTLIKEVKENSRADTNLVEISNEIIANQEQFIESLKKFL